MLRSTKYRNIGRSNKEDGVTRRWEQRGGGSSDESEKKKRVEKKKKKNEKIA